MIGVTWSEVTSHAQRLAARHAMCGHSHVYGVPRGGVAPAIMAAGLLNLPLVDRPEYGALIVDDLVDSGRTAEGIAPVPERGCFDALYRKPHSPAHHAPNAEEVNAWLVFPWEQDAAGSIEDAIVRLIQHIGENPNRDGLLDTPKRVAKAFREMTTGYDTDPAAILGTTFHGEGYKGMVHVDGIQFVSLCEHHMLPFTGEAHVAYIPRERVVGLSKIPRIVTAFANRLQVQERLTEQIADALDEHLNPLGVGVSITAHHSCMGLRGAKQAHATMTTTSLRGLFWMQETRAEFLRA